MSLTFLKDTAERAVQAFVTSYLGIWVAGGADFDGLAAADNLKTGVVAAALSVAASFGLKKVGPNKQSGSII